MTDHDIEPPFNTGQTFVDELNGTEWLIADVTREYKVEIVTDGEDGEVEELETAWYPEGSIRNKLAVGDLEPPAPAGVEFVERDAEHTCEECGASFDSEQALYGHQVVHSPGGPDSDDEAAAAPADTDS